MNETDFMESEESGETPVDMFNIKDKDNLERRDSKIESAQMAQNVMDIINGKRGYDKL